MNRLCSLQKPSGLPRPSWVSTLQALVAAGIACLVALPASAATLTQTLTLQQGWNAVWLEVEPRDAQGQLQTAGQVFNSPDFNIDQVAVQSLPVGTAEFSTDPSKLSGQPGWILWSRTPASGESGTVTVVGYRAYLLHVSAASGATTREQPPVRCPSPGMSGSIVRPGSAVATTSLGSAFRGARPSDRCSVPGWPTSCRPRSAPRSRR